MTKPKRQHWVPRLYLASFATPETTGTKDPDIWCFPKDKGDPFCTSIKNIAAETHLYSPIGPDGARSWEMEEKLGDLESTISPLWRSLANDYLDLSQDSTRKGLALFIATLFLRNPQRIQDQRKLQNDILARFESLQQRTVARLGLNEKNTLPGVAPGLSDKDSNALQHGFVEHIRAASRRLAERLMEKRWAVVYTDAPAFATSDNPLMVTHEDELLRGLDFLGGMLVLPVSPTRVLMFDDSAEPPNEYYLAKPHTPGACNTWAMRHGLRFLLSSVHSDEILAGIVSAGDALGTSDAGV